jgi:hypothetical protein
MGNALPRVAGTTSVTLGEFFTSSYMEAERLLPLSGVREEWKA